MGSQFRRIFPNNDMTNYTKQIDAHEYQGHSYRKQERWDSFWHQIDLLRILKPASVLEVGPGPGVVTHALRQSGIAVTTADIAEDVGADVVCSVTKLPFEQGQFDTAIAAEILEHIDAKDVPVALRELRRVVTKGVVISVPTPGSSFRFLFKIPLVPHLRLFFKVPHFWKTHTFDGQHYWELGTKGRSQKWFISLAEEAGFRLRMTRVYEDAPYHRFFVFDAI